MTAHRARSSLVPDPFFEVFVSYRSVYAIVLFAISVFAPGVQGEVLTVSFTPDTVVVTSDQRTAHRYVLFTVGREMVGHTPMLTREVLVQTDEDANGSITFTPQRIPAESLWVAVNIDSGAYAVASPQEALPALLPIADASWGVGVTHVNSDLVYLEALFVRPATGGWVLRATDGGPQDGDQSQNSSVRLLLAGMNPLSNETDAPAVAAQNDVLVLADPQSLHYVVKVVR